MLISKKQLKEMLLWSYAHIDRKLDPKSPYYDPFFPRKVKVGNSRVGFVKAEAEAYLQRLIGQRDNSS